VTLKYKDTKIRANFGEFGKKFKFPPPTADFNSDSKNTTSSLNNNPSNTNVTDRSNHNQNNNTNTLNVTTVSASSNPQNVRLSSENKQRCIVLPVAATSPQQRVREMKKAKKNEKYNQNHSILYILPQEVLLVIYISFVFSGTCFLLSSTKFFLQAYIFSFENQRSLFCDACESTL
jgi:hypothetical protein